LQIEFEDLFNEYFISSYGKNYIVIKEKKYFDRVILLGSIIDNCKDVKTLFNDNLFHEKINQLNRLDYNFILFGTGKKLEKIPLKTHEFIIKNNIAHESMSSVSAFKTYNILLSQGKKILAFLELET
jgi:uncharacterized protein